MRCWVLLPLALGVSTALAQETRSMREIYAAARKEHGVFRFFSGGDIGNHFVASKFQQTFPGIPIEGHVDLSKYLDARVNRGFDENKPVADVIISQHVNDFPHWKAQGHLVPYKYINFTKVTDAGKHPEGYYTPVSYHGYGTIVFDKTKCPEHTIPNSYADFVNPAWKGKLILTYPNDDDAVAFLFAKTVNALGYEWLDGLANNDVEWVRGTYTPTDLLTRYHNDPNNPRCASFTASGGDEQWWGYATPGDNRNEAYWLQTAGLLTGSQRPETQKLFLNWYIQNFSGAIYKENYVPVRGADYFQSLTGNFSNFMRDRAQVERWRFYFEDKFGTPQGPSPIQLYPDRPERS